MQTRIYRAMLRLLPKEFRQEFGQDMARDFESRVRATRGLHQTMILWWSAAADVVRAAIAERNHHATRGIHTARTGTFGSDLRMGARLLMRRPNYAIVSILTLGIGIGTVTALFSVVDGVLLKPLPYVDSERLVLIGSPYLRPQNAAEWAATQPVVEASAIYSLENGTAMTAGGAVNVTVMPVDQTFFRLVGAPRHEGRMFTAEDHDAGSPAVVVLSASFRRKYFGEDAIGKSVSINGKAFQVVGVISTDFEFLGDHPDAWVPVSAFPLRGVRMVARLPVGVTPAEALTRLAPFADRMATPERRKLVESLHAVPLRVTGALDLMVETVRKTLWTLLGAAAVVLLLSAANVATLSIGNALSRREELAVRSALGAARGRLLKMLVAESLVLAFAGAAVGVIVATLAPTLLQLAPNVLPRNESIHTDWRVIVFALGAAALTCMIFGVLPGLAVSRWNEIQSLRNATTRGRRAGIAQSLLIVGEIASALVLVVGAVLLARTYAALRPVDPGFRLDDRVIASIQLPEDAYSDMAERTRFVGALMDAIRRMPGSPRAEISSDVPFTGMTQSFEATSEAMQAPERIHFRATTPRYLNLLEMPIMHGRGLGDSDRSGSVDVVVINEAAARKYFRDASQAVGRALTVTVNDAARSLRVVGVVRDSWIRLGPETEPEAFAPVAQWPQRRFQVVFESTGTQPVSEKAVRELVASIDSRVPVQEFAGLRDIAAASITMPRFQATLLGTLTLIALFLAAVGCFAVLSQLVGRRVRELGIRMALGARAANVAWIVLRRVMGLTAAGVAIGILIGLFATRVLASALYGVTPTDPSSFAAAAILLFVVVAAAAVRPVMRAVACDPVHTLKEG